jgi:selenocysteine lyase/cysteine desulfurase
MNDIDYLATRLYPHYSRFDVANRLLFTGHSHQAWPDVAREGLAEAYDITARHVDKKWKIADEKTKILRSYLRNYYDDPGGLYCRGENTHQLLISWLSALDLRNKPKIITTDGEFHSMFRQLQRLSEEGVNIARVEAERDDITRQIQENIDDQTCAVMLSRVYFKSSLVNRYIPEIAQIVRKNNIPLLIDDYHGTNVVPLSIKQAGLQDCFLVTGGYKYLQWGEGNCFLRFPQNCSLRPVLTGWFASFNTLEHPRTQGLVQYGEGNQRFAGGTYDPSAQFRAAKVVAFFREQNLTQTVLRLQYIAQVQRLRRVFQEQRNDPKIIKLYHQKPLAQNGGFLALQSPFARRLQTLLFNEKVFTDARGHVLRFGPAPYTTTQQIDRAMKKLAGCIQKIQKNNL